MADYDEYDALLDEPFGEDVDWAAIDGMVTPSTGQQTRASPDYFSDDDGVDDAFLDEVRRLEERAMARADADLSGSGSGTTIAHHGVSSSTAPPPSFWQRLDGQYFSIPGTSSAGGPSHSNHILAPTSIAAPLAAHGELRFLSPEPPPPSWVQTNSDIPFFLDPPPKFAKTTSCGTQVTLQQQKHNEPPIPSAPRKRRRSSTYSSDYAIPANKGKTRMREAKSEVLETFESALECPICFDIMAASHVLSCGHAACGVCLAKWLYLNNRKAACFSCRARHKRGLIPNFTVDAMAAAYFDERQKNAAEAEAHAVAQDKIRWERRRAEGKAAVHEATENFIKKKKAAPNFPPVPLHSFHVVA